METAKPWYLSRTIWASVVTIVTAAGTAFGLPLAGIDTGALAETLLQAVTAVSGLIALLGRMKATARIGQA